MTRVFDYIADVICFVLTVEIKAGGGGATGAPMGGADYGRSKRPLEFDNRGPPQQQQQPPPPFYGNQVGDWHLTR